MFSMNAYAQEASCAAGRPALWWQALTLPAHGGRLVLEDRPPPHFDAALLAGAALLYAVYGAAMGLYRGYYPAAVSGVKLPLLFLLTLAVSLPLFYALNALAGPRLTPRQWARLLLLASSAQAVALASLAPIALLFTAAAETHGPAAQANYLFLCLLHLAALAACGLVSVGMAALLLRAVAAAQGVRLHGALLAFLAAVYAAVTAQAAWALRPWVGSHAVPYTALRPREGSFPEAVLALITSMFG